MNIYAFNTAEVLLDLLISRGGNGKILGLEQEIKVERFPDRSLVDSRDLGRISNVGNCG